MEGAQQEPVSGRADPFDFYRRIGSPKYFVAPMVEHSELAYRMMCRAYGAPVVFTQMIHARGFIDNADTRGKIFVTCPEDRPLIVQFNGDDPDTILAAAKIVEHQCDAVDINLGCPQGIARRGHYGAFLMEELELLTAIVSTVSKGLKVPVTCKTRIYKDFDRSVRLCETLYQAGASMLTIHGRTREEKGQMVAEVDWDMIRRLKAHFGNRVPIVANGGIQNLEDVQRCLKITGCDGVMSSEGVLENPALFGGGVNAEGRTLTQLELAEEYLRYARKYPEPTILKKIRGHLMKFLYRYFTVHFEVRNMMAAAQSIDEHEDVCKELRRLVVNDSDYDGASWYRRHRGDPPVPLAIAADAERAVAASQNPVPAPWNVEDVEYSECGEGGGVFGSMFE